MLHINDKIIIRIVAYSPLVFIPLIVFVIAFMSVKMLDDGYATTIDSLKKNIEEKEREILRSKVDGVVDYVAYQKSRFKKDNSKEILEVVNVVGRVGDKYIFVFNYKGDTLLNAAKPELVGQNMIKSNDEQTTKVYRAIMKSVEKKGKGFVSYKWKNPKTKLEDTKHSYASQIPNTDWIIGSGYYEKTIQNATKKQMFNIQKSYDLQLDKLLLISTALLIFSLIVSYFISKSIKDSFLSYQRRINAKNEALEGKIKQVQSAQKMLIESEKMASLGSLVAGVAHEVNTPLGVALTGISHMEHEIKVVNNKYKKEELTEENLLEFINLIQSVANTVHKSIKNAVVLVKSFKHISVDQHSDEKRKFNLKKYFDETVMNLKNSIKNKDIEIINDIDDSIQLYTYAGAYSQIFSNLIINSIKHAFINTKNNKIHLTSEVKDNQLILHYKDNGVGVSEKIKDKIFDPFFTTARGQGGSGLGLNIVYNLIIKKLSGTINIVEESQEKGLHLKFTVKYIKSDK